LLKGKVRIVGKQASHLRVVEDLRHLFHLDMKLELQLQPFIVYYYCISQVFKFCSIEFNLKKEKKRKSQNNINKELPLHRRGLSQF